jgi:hypothetical protein
LKEYAEFSPYIKTDSAFHKRASGVLFTKTENVAVGILDVEVQACPWSFFEGLDHFSPTRLQLAEEASDTRHGNVRIQMLVLFPVLSVGHQFRRMLEVYREPITHNTRIERLILEIELEAEPVTIVRNRSVKIVDQKLGGYPGNLRSAMTCHWNTSFLDGMYGWLPALGIIYHDEVRTACQRSRPHPAQIMSSDGVGRLEQLDRTKVVQ